jgi:PIN domain nuclease of toxin-antitoxin system
MNTKKCVTDTHSLVWYFTENPRLSRKALKVFEKTVKEGTIIIPAVVLAEIMYIAKKGRIPMSFAETVKKIEDSENFAIIPLDLDILKKADEIDYEFEIHDRLIVAAALLFDAPLLTKDQTIKESNLCRVIW